MALIHVGFLSQSLGMCVSCDVILPEASQKLIGMETEVKSGKHKVLWLLHGMSDNHTIWQRRTSIERYASRLGLAVVMPNGHLSGYSNMAHGGGGKYFTYITEELPRIMRTFFAFSEKREDNFICGLSMGGAGAMKLGLACPETYSVIGCLSAGAMNRHELTPENPSESLKKRMHLLYGDRDLAGTEEDVYFNANEILEKGLTPPRIYHACGDKDFLLDVAHTTRDFFTSLDGNPFDYKYDEDPGAHTWEFWDDHIQKFLEYLKLD
ncbi:MAG: esterase family protein [Clostridia bacterium]|nr:esterase family protein [Clostridia bacterium]